MPVALLCAMTILSLLGVAILFHRRKIKEP